MAPTHCRRCGNKLFDCGLQFEPLWCGACDLRVPRTEPAH